MSFSSGLGSAGFFGKNWAGVPSLGLAAHSERAGVAVRPAAASRESFNNSRLFMVVALVA